MWNACASSFKIESPRGRSAKRPRLTKSMKHDKTGCDIIKYLANAHDCCIHTTNPVAIIVCTKAHFCVNAEYAI